MRKKEFGKWMAAAVLLGALSIGMTAYAEEGGVAVPKKLVQEHEYTFNSEAGIHTLRTVGVYSYDGQGNLVKYTPFDTDGSIKWGSVDHIYDGQGNRTARIQYDEPGKISEWDEYVYDDQGNEVRHVKHASDSSILWWDAYVYDGEGNRVQMISYDNSALLEWREYGYDSQGNLTSENFYGADNVLYCRNEYVFDGQGNPVKDLYYNYVDGVQTLATWAEYIYDAQGKEVNRVKYFVDENYIAMYGPIAQWTGHDYDDQGNRIKTTDIYYGEYDNIWESYYDAQGNEIRFVGYSHSGVLESLQESGYDGEGNCIKRVFYDVDGTGIPSVSYWTDSVYQ